MPYLAVLCLALVGVIVYLLRQHALREDAWRLERVGLLQRIQAPERAVIAQAQTERRPLPPPPRIELNDDEAFARLHDGPGD